MNKYVLTFVSIALILSFGACSNEDLTEIEKENDYTLSFTASMPDDHTPTTRLSLTDDAVNKLINVEWKNGDQIRVVIVQGENVFHVNNTNPIAITPETSNPKRGSFTIEFAQNGWNDFNKSLPFKVYGVYGASGIDGTKAKLPNYHQSLYSTLEGLGNNHQVMLYFSYDHPGIPAKESGTDDVGDISVTFKHTGSLFRIKLKNLNNHPEDWKNTIYIDHARFTGVDINKTNWAYNNIPDIPQLKFDLLTGEFFTDNILQNYMMLYPPTNKFSKGDIHELWRWHPVDGKIWPSLKLELINENVVIATSGEDTKSAKKALKAGQVYNFYATMKDGVIKFTNENFEEPTN